MYRDIKILSECTLLLMYEYLLIVNVNKCKKYCVLLCCFIYTLFHEFVSTFFWNKISLPERRNKRKSVLEITKMYYFYI